ncbi:MAG: hypothetical protein ABSG56_18895 [Bryobacteraceae bacterium]|jgi:hypothetical protein
MKTGYLALLLAPLTLLVAGAPSDALAPAAVPEAERALFAARYDQAAELYSKLLRDNPAWAHGYYGIVRLESLGDENGVSFGGILGMPVLSQMRMTIDYRNGAVRFERTTR